MSAFAQTRSDVERARGGDPAGFEGLWHRYRPGLGSWLSRELRSRLAEPLRARLIAEEDDLLQLAFGRALKQLNQYEYRGSGSFLAWLQQIAKNVLRERLEYWQADKRTPLREQKAASPGISSHTGPGDDPERLVSPATGPVTAQLRSEKQERITDLLSQLPERDYLIVWFRFFGGASWAEVAELVGAASADAVRIECVQRIFPKLAPLLGNDQDD